MSRLPTSHLDRRGLLTGAAALTAGLVAACGSDDSSGTSRSGAKASTSASSGSGFPVRVSGAEGSVTVESRPKRIVSVGYLRDTDLALALGADLVGTTRNVEFRSGLAPWQSAARTTTLLDATGGMPYEKIAALDPDLILATDDFTLAKDEQLLSKIAPTLGYRRSPNKDSWQEMTERAGEVLGKEQKSKQLVSDTERIIEATRRAHPELEGLTFTSGPATAPDQLYTTISTADPGVMLYQQLGLRLSPRVRDLPPSSTPSRAKVSIEDLHIIDADIIMIGYPNAAVRRQFESQPLFRKLTAVRRGAYLATYFENGLALSFPSVLSIPYGLKQMAPRLAAAARRAQRTPA